MGTCITSCWTLAQGRSDRCTVKEGIMVKKVALSLLALIPFLSITGYVIPSISHSSRFGSEAGHVLQAISITTVRKGTSPHREAMGLLSRCCGVEATLSTWLTSSLKPTADVIMRYAAPRTLISIGELRGLGETSWCRRIVQIQSNSSTSWTSRRDPQDPLPPLHEVQLRHPEWKCP